MWAAAVQSNGRMTAEMRDMDDGDIPILGVLVKKSRFWYLGKKMSLSSFKFLNDCNILWEYLIFFVTVKIF